jgi:catalase
MARRIGLTLALTIAFAGNASLAIAQQNEVTAEEVVTALEGACGVHPGERRNHTKGTRALGSFVGMLGAAVYYVP